MDREISMIKKREKELVVYVTWVDPHSVDAWTTVEELDLRPAYIRSVGYLVAENKKCIAISPNIGDERIDNVVSCTTIIPRQCIVSIYVTRKTIVKKHELP